MKPLIPQARSTRISRTTGCPRRHLKWESFILSLTVTKLR